MDQFRTSVFGTASPVSTAPEHNHAHHSLSARVTLGGSASLNPPHIEAMDGCVETTRVTMTKNKVVKHWTVDEPMGRESDEKGEGVVMMGEKGVNASPEACHVIHPSSIYPRWKSRGRRDVPREVGNREEATKCTAQHDHKFYRCGQEATEPTS